MAGSTRLELATSGVTGRRSNQLNYNPAKIPTNLECVISYNHKKICQEESSGYEKKSRFPSSFAGNMRYSNCLSVRHQCALDIA